MTTTDARTAVAVDPPGRPRVPRAPFSFVAKLFGVIAAGVLGGYLYLGLTGSDFGSDGERDVVPPTVRTSPGGYRSFAFWHSGYEGGK
jgi:hypothetical protein